MYYFIVNPASGSGRGRSVWKTVKKELQRCGMPYQSFLLSKPGEGRPLAASLVHAKKPFTVVVVGGDGTIDEVVDGLYSVKDSKKGSTLPDGITFGCIPTGSGNDFVRGLGLAKNPVHALHAILHPREIRKINIGHVNCTATNSHPKEFNKYTAAARLLSEKESGTGTYRCHLAHSFAVSSGIGFDAAVCDSVADSRLKTALNLFRSGKLVYLFTALWQLFSMKRRTLRITIDDGGTQAFGKAYFAAAMNLRFEGGGFMFCPDAKEDDDSIDLFFANGISRLRALTILPLAFAGRHVGKNGVHIVRCKKAVVESDALQCMHTDGEILGFYSRAEFSLHAKKLAVIIR